MIFLDADWIPQYYQCPYRDMSEDEIQSYLSLARGRNAVVVISGNKVYLDCSLTFRTEMQDDYDYNGNYWGTKEVTVKDVFSTYLDINHRKIKHNCTDVYDYLHDPWSHWAESDLLGLPKHRTIGSEEFFGGLPRGYIHFSIISGIVQNCLKAIFTPFRLLPQYPNGSYTIELCPGYAIQFIATNGRIDNMGLQTSGFKSTKFSTVIEELLKV